MGVAHERSRSASSGSVNMAIRSRGSFAAHVEREEKMRAEVSSPQTRKRDDALPLLSSFSFSTLPLSPSTSRSPMMALKCPTHVSEEQTRSI